MQSWLKLGPHASVLQEPGRSQDVHQGSTEHIRQASIQTLDEQNLWREFLCLS